MDKLRSILERLKNSLSRKKADPYDEADELIYQDEDEELNQSLVYEVNEDTELVKELPEDDAASMKKEIPLANVVKLLIFVLIFIGMIVLGFILNPFSTNRETTSQVSIPQREEKHQADMADSAIPPVNELALALKKNPFIEAAAIQADSATDGSNSGQKAANGNKVSYTANSNLPAIPNNYPRPQIPMPGQINIPPRNDGQPVSASSTGSPVAVQGVLTGEDGHNMAIMSDGSIVSEGETFQDGRIAYIGGDGITFENGNKIDYK